MKQGEFLNGFRVLTKPIGGGQGQWAIAERGGRQYFIKMFLKPKYPRVDGPGSEAVKQRLIQECEAFELRNRHLNVSINPRQLGAGNLVVTLEIFRLGSIYYKVTDVIIPAKVKTLAELHPHQALTVIRTMLLSIRLLHRAGFVHGDLKPDNVIIQETRPGVFVSKVIDFDDGYVSGHPPAEPVGDPPFYSPELFLFVKSNALVKPENLTTASDVFAAGVLLHLMITGEPPDFDRERYKLPCEAAINGALSISKVQGPLKAWLEQMLNREPALRPTIDDVTGFFLSMKPEELNEHLGSLRELRKGSRPSELRSSVARTAGVSQPESGSTSPGLKSTIRKSD